MAAILAGDYSRYVSICELAKRGRFHQALRAVGDLAQGDYRQSAMSEIVKQLVAQNRLFEAISLTNGNCELYKRIVTTLESRGRLPEVYSQALKGQECPKMFRAVALACASDAAAGPTQEQLLKTVQSQIEAPSS